VLPTLELVMRYNGGLPHLPRNEEPADVDVAVLHDDVLHQVALQRLAVNDIELGTGPQVSQQFREGVLVVSPIVLLLLDVELGL